MPVTPIRSFEDFRDAVSAYRLPRILISALELDLFTVMGSVGGESVLPTLKSLGY